MANTQELVERIWSVAELARGSLRRRDYGQLILPLLLLQRVECLSDSASHSGLTLKDTLMDPRGVRERLRAYVETRPISIRQVVDDLRFLDVANLLGESIYPVVSAICALDLSRESVPDDVITSVVLELLQRSDQGAELEAGAYLTPPDVAALLVALLLESETLPSRIRVLDPACGTGSLLLETTRQLEGTVAVESSGQDINQFSAAIARLLGLIAPGLSIDVRIGDSLVDDQFSGEQFDFAVCHPPFGLPWKHVQSEVTAERERVGSGRFPGGLPRVNDSSLLFLQHMLAKAGRVATALHASPLFVGEAGSGESEIRRYLAESDLLECIVALPPNLFHNTPIETFIWVLSRTKPSERRGHVQLIDARQLLRKRTRGIGEKRNEMDPASRDRILAAYRDAESSDISRIIDVEQLGYRRLTVERPLRLVYRMTSERKARFLEVHPHLLESVQAIDAKIGRRPFDWVDAWRDIQLLTEVREAEWTRADERSFRDVCCDRDPQSKPVRSSSGELEADARLRDYERVPLTDDVDSYMAQEVSPFAPDAWVSGSRVGYEISFAEFFPTHDAPRPLSEIERDLRNVRARLERLLSELPV